MKRRISVFLTILGCLPWTSLWSADDAIRGFIAVEPFEVRLEAIVKVAAYRNTWRLEEEFIDAARRQVILDNVATLLETGVNMNAPGTDIVFSGRSARFVRLDPEKGYATDERDEIPVQEALVGITLSSDVRNVREVVGEWLWFAPGQEQLILEIASRGKPSARYLSPQKSRFEWKLEETISVPTLLDVPKVERNKSAPLRYLLYVGIAMLLFAAVEVIRKKQKSPAWVGWLVIGGIACGFFSFRFKVDRVEALDSTGVDKVTYSLLRNIYHAFDFRDESAIYDTLEKSVSGPLLEKVYLEIRKSLELENSGGPRVRVYEIALRDCNLSEDVGGEQGESQAVLANWATIGEVTHWGHTHERTNRYEARLTVAPFDAEWKVVALDLLNEERIQKVSRRITEPQKATSQ